jgi:ribose 5-phosphate isomerase B
MKLYLGSDHAGFEMKEKLKSYLKRAGYDFEDCGTNSTEPVDYPDIASKVAVKVSKARGSKGILICGTGTGMVIAANKIRGIRAAEAYDNYSAKMSRNDNDANVLGLRGRNFPYEKAKKTVSVWLKTPFSNEARHKKRIDKIRKLEGK